MEKRRNDYTSISSEETEMKIYTPRFSRANLSKQDNIQSNFPDHAPVRIYKQPVKSDLSDSESSYML
ncbi:MAG: hypothetical protein IJZ64_01700 [Ruminococcus sp.]|nr:hypothetical protein [Ruminococcus sp.]